MMKTIPAVVLIALFFWTYGYSEVWHDPAACNTAQVITCGERLNNQTNVGFANKLDNYRCGSSDIVNGYNGAERIYRLDVPERKEYTITLNDITGSGINYDLFLMEGSCEAGNCLYSSTNNSTKSEQITAILERGSYFIIADTWAGETGTFDLSVSCTTPPPPPSCAGALLIQCGNRLSGTTRRADNDYDASVYNCYDGSSSYAGGDVIYAFEKKHSRDDIQIHLFTEEENLNIFLVNQCDRDGFNCILTGKDFADGKYISEGNFGMPAGLYYVIVDGATASTEGDFELLLTCGTMDVPSHPLVCDSTLPRQDLSDEEHHWGIYNCGRRKSEMLVDLVGPEKYYDFTLSETTSITVTVSNPGNIDDLELLLFEEGQLMPQCVTIGDKGFTSITISERLPAGRYMVVVDSREAMTYDITLTGCPCEADDVLVCDTPIRSSNRTATNSIAEISSGCVTRTTEVGARDRIFEFTAEESQNYTFLLTDLTADLDLFILDDCSEAGTCLANSRRSGDDQITIALTAGQTVFALVDGSARMVRTDFTISVSCVEDLDLDGIPDADDNCVNTPNPDQANNDGDDFGDVCDDDDDNDGVLDDVDCDPLDASIAFKPGDACDDGDDDTINDTIQDDCSCQGIPDNVRNPIQLTIENVTGAFGQTVCFDISATDFTDITAASFSINIDPAVATITSVSNISLIGGTFTGSGVSMSGSGGAMTGSGSGFVVWTVDGGDPVSLGLITPIVEVCAEITDPTFDKATISITNEPVVIEFLDENADVVPVVSGTGQLCRDTTAAAMVAISGRIAGVSDISMQNVEVRLSGDMQDMSMTGTDGAYTLAAAVGGSYEVSPVITSTYMEDVSLMDALIFRKHLIQTETFTSDYQYIAADIDRSGHLSVRDEVFIKRMILGMDEQRYPYWTFVTADHDFGDVPDFTLQGDVFDYPEQIAVEQLIDEVEQDFIAVRMGDLQIDQEGSSRSVGRTIGYIKSDKNTDGYQIVIENPGAFNGLSLKANVGNLEISNISTNYGQDVAVTYRIDEKGSLHALFILENDQQLENDLIVTITTDDGIRESQVNLESSQFITKDFVEYEIDWTEKSVDELVTADVSPNPFANQTTLLIKSQVNDNDAWMQIYDAIGRMIQSENIKIVKGLNELIIEKEKMNLPTGVNYVDVTVGGQTIQKKILVIE